MRLHENPYRTVRTTAEILRSRDHPQWDLAAVRREFPALEQRVHERPLAYLDNAATAQKPYQVIEAVARFYRRDNANVHRGVHALGERAPRRPTRRRGRSSFFAGPRRPSTSSPTVLGKACDPATRWC